MKPDYKIQFTTPENSLQIVSQVVSRHWLVLLPVKFFGSTFHILVHLFKKDFWNVVVLHRVVVNDKWSGSDDLVSLWLLRLVG
jgi:hypothetical protein